MGDNGEEVLVHIGINTVELNGEGFEAKVSQGDHVNAGDLLITCDFKTIEDKGYKTITPVILTNTTNFTDVKLVSEGVKTAGEAVLVATR